MMKANPVWLKDMLECIDDLSVHAYGTPGEVHWFDWCREARRRLRSNVRDLRNMPGQEELDVLFTNGEASMSWDTIKDAFRRGNREHMLEVWRHVA